MAQFQNQVNILQYEPKIWETADLLRGSGIKESEWPSYMMPFFALAMIESRFRTDSKIEHGNTLVEDKLYNEEFDVVVANPPYGVSWKGYQKDINNDKTERFKFLPSISDGQLLFMQHLISKLDAVGMGVVVHNGSTLFSGDAGSAESNIRKWMLNSDIVEAVIQLPTDEFFNTGIYTYLWVLNKNKQPEHIEISVELTPDYQKDYEIISFHKDEAENHAEIADFMTKYITKPFSYLENVVGVELNFNKIFYKPEKLREVVDILAEIDALDGELKELEAGLVL